MVSEAVGVNADGVVPVVTTDCGVRSVIRHLLLKSDRASAE
jgi:hypothetical protein